MAGRSRPPHAGRARPGAARSGGPGRPESGSLNSCLFRQGARLKAHARAKGVRLIGDLPFFVSPDSSDVWAQPRAVPARRAAPAAIRRRSAARLLQRAGTAVGQSRSTTGTRFGARGYRWCIDRLRALLAHVDAIRLDHFRGIRGGMARAGRRADRGPGSGCPGPGADLFGALETAFGGLPFVAEDLGIDHAGRESRSVTRFVSRGRAFCSSPSTAIPTIRICPTTTFPTPSSTRARTTIRRRVDGSRTCPTPSGATCGATCEARDAAPARTPPRPVAIWRGRRRPPSRSRRCRTCSTWGARPG